MQIGAVSISIMTNHFNLRALLLTFLLFSLTGTPSASAEMYKWTDEKGFIHYSNVRPKIKATTEKRNDSIHQKPAAPNEALIPSVVPTRNNTSTNRRNFNIDDGVFLPIRKLLEQKRFDELNDILHGFQVEFESDPVGESLLFSFYSAFGKNDPSYEELLTAWIDANPNSYQPYLARATYYCEAGWNSRGTKWARETTSEQFIAMDTYFEKARKDADTAITLYERSMVPYEILIGMALAQSRIDDAKNALNKALSINPLTYKVRASYLRMVAPRWGGSFEDMQAVVNESLPFVPRNKKLKHLPGQILDEMASLQESQKKFSSAEEIYTKALEHAENYVVLFHRGRVRYNQANFQGALQDLNRAIELHKDSSDFFYLRAVTYNTLKEYELAAQDIERAALLTPDDSDIDRLRQKIAAMKITQQSQELTKNNQTDEAVNNFDNAILLDPQNAMIRYNKARLLIEQNELDAAIHELEKAIEINPHEINFYIAIDLVLAQRKEWDRIISYWNQFILFHPDNSRAYLERSGTYHHKGEKDAAYNDLKTAAQMGDQQAEQLLRRHFN